MPAGEKKARKPRAKKGDDAKKGGDKHEEKVKEEKEDPKKSDKKLSMYPGKAVSVFYVSSVAVIPDRDRFFMLQQCSDGAHTERRLSLSSFSQRWLARVGAS